MVLKVLLRLESFGMLNKSTISLVFVIILVATFIFIQNKNETVTFKEKDVVKIQPKNCNLESKECVVELNEIKVKILFDENIYYLKPFNVSVMNENLNNLKLESIYVDFKMNNMNMGVNRFLLKNDDDKSIWQGKALLPICVTGRADWLSEIELATKTNKYLISLPISVKKLPN